MIGVGGGPFWGSATIIQYVERQRSLNEVASLGHEKGVLGVVTSSVDGQPPFYMPL